MLLASIASFLKFKIVSNIVVLACWPPLDQLKLVKLLNQNGIQATFSCNTDRLDRLQNDRFLGVLVIGDKNDHILEKIKLEHTSAWYKWLLVMDKVPRAFDSARYDADITILSPKILEDIENATDYPDDIDLNLETVTKSLLSIETSYLQFEDVFINLGSRTSRHPWAVWSQANGFQVLFDRERILRRKDVKGYPFRIATPLAHFADGHYNGTFDQYLRDDTKTEHDRSIRCGYGSALLLSESLNATPILVPTKFWTSEADNSSMTRMLAQGDAELGAILRILRTRIEVFDYVMPLWPFTVGFIYLAERESSGNMFVTPFSPGVWWACLGSVVVLAVVLRITARSAVEKDEALYAVLSSWLQQDASAVPTGASGRWTFMVVSVSSMLVYAYYSSAIVSALMSAGRSGPATLRELADSRYAIASEDYDYMRYFMFDRPSNKTDLEYLKKKKMTKNLYQTIERGTELIKEGNTAFHAEYINMYPFISKFTDDKICKLSYVDTYPTSLAWTTTTKRSQFTDMMRSAGDWIHETGLRTRLVSKWNSQPAPCRTSLLAERVKFGDVAPLMGVTVLSIFLSFVILGLEILVARRGKQSFVGDVDDDVSNKGESWLQDDNGFSG